MPRMTGPTSHYQKTRFPTGQPNDRPPFHPQVPQPSIHPRGYFPRVHYPQNIAPNYIPQVRPFPCPNPMAYSPSMFEAPNLQNAQNPIPQYAERTTRFTIPSPIPSAQVYVPTYHSPHSTLPIWGGKEVPRTSDPFTLNIIQPVSKNWNTNLVPLPEDIPENPQEDLVPPGTAEIEETSDEFGQARVEESIQYPVIKDAGGSQEYRSTNHSERKSIKSPTSRRRSKSPPSRRRSKSPTCRRRSKSPTCRRRSKSPPSRRWNKSPPRLRSKSPTSRQRRSKSPSRWRSKSPSSRQRNKISPSHHHSRTPSSRRCSKTPASRNRRSSSPRHRSKTSPLRRRSKTPSSHRRSRTPSSRSRRYSRRSNERRGRQSRDWSPYYRRSRRSRSHSRTWEPRSRKDSRSSRTYRRERIHSHSSESDREFSHHTKGAYSRSPDNPPSSSQESKCNITDVTLAPGPDDKASCSYSSKNLSERELLLEQWRADNPSAPSELQKSPTANITLTPGPDDEASGSYSNSASDRSPFLEQWSSPDNPPSASQGLGFPTANITLTPGPDGEESYNYSEENFFEELSLEQWSSPDNPPSASQGLGFPTANITLTPGPDDEESFNYCEENFFEELSLEQWRLNFCANSAEMQQKLDELAKMKPEEIVEHEKKVWTRTAPADLYYRREETNSKVMRATPMLMTLCDKFRTELLERAEQVRTTRPAYEPPPRKNRMRLARHKSEICSSSESLSDDSTTDEEDCTMEELERKRLHPYRLHPEMWYNDSGEMNDGPLCRCSAKARRYGIRHGIYAGESHLPKCELDCNNADRLYHYRITISPPTNFLTKTPTIIKYDEHEFIFEGFSMFSHFPLDQLPTCKVIRFNIEYTILYIDEKLPENFTIRELDLFYEYLFHELLELVDLDFKAHGDSTGCSQFHFMPRFVRDLLHNGKEILSMNEVMNYLINNSKPLIEEGILQELLLMPQFKWQNFADEVKGMVVTYPGMKPCSVRVDQLDRDQQKIEDGKFPEIVHFGIRPPQLSYAGNPEYQKSWREYVKFRHLLANMPKPSFEDKRKLESKENKLQEMRTQSKMKRDVTVAVSAKGFHRTGIMCDIIQHAMLIPVLVCHLRFHRSCNVLEEAIGYKFKNRFLLQLALTHPSYRENFGTNPDHARNSLTNCGIRQPEYGDRRIHYMNTRKRGINTLINIMSRFGKKTATESNITHNERLEFLGDAVVEFLTSIHLFHMFPDLEEGGLATYRAAIVQNQHLAVLAKTLNLEEFMLYAHGSDLCHDLELRHAMANCFEALMGALFLDGGIEVADKVFGETLFKGEDDLLDIWVNYPPHPLQEQEPLGDRKWIPSFELLQNLTKFEEATGVEFKHIRLLARAFTDRSIGYTNLTLGSNQRLEFLGDTVLQLIASEYLYKYFPEHHEGHLSLLRSSLVNNRTQAVVCDDLGMIAYALYSNPKVELKTKDRADLLEAYLGALYVDKGLDFCQVFCNVCFFPRLQDFIMNQDWNDPKSKLQQCCLTLRTMEGGEPDIPVYKVIECKGPTNTRVYSVAVYFRGIRLAKASGHSIQQAEMNAAKRALEKSQDLFPQLDHQKRVIAKSLWRQQRWPSSSDVRSRISPDQEKPSTSRDRPKSSRSSKGKRSSRDRRKGRSTRHKKSASNEPVPSTSGFTTKSKQSPLDKKVADSCDSDKLVPLSPKAKKPTIEVINEEDNDDDDHDDDDDDDYYDVEVDDDDSSSDFDSVYMK